MKCSKGKSLSMNPPTHPVGPGGQQDQEHGVVLHNQEEGYQPPINFRSGSSQVPEGLSMTPLPTQVDHVNSKIKEMG